MSNTTYHDGHMTTFCEPVVFIGDGEDIIDVYAYCVLPRFGLSFTDKLPQMSATRAQDDWNTYERHIRCNNNIDLWIPWLLITVYPTPQDNYQPLTPIDWSLMRS